MMVAEDDVFRPECYTGGNFLKGSGTHIGGQRCSECFFYNRHIFLSTNWIFQVFEIGFKLLAILNGGIHFPEGIWINPQGNIRAE